MYVCNVFEMHCKYLHCRPMLDQEGARQRTRRRENRMNAGSLGAKTPIFQLQRRNLPNAQIGQKYHPDLRPPPTKLGRPEI